MPKKTRKAKIRASQRPMSAGYASAPVAMPTAQPTRETYAPRAATPAPAARAFTPVTVDYGYVFRDLRRIGLLAVIFFGLMLVLWFLVEVQGVHLIPGVF